MDPVANSHREPHVVVDDKYTAAIPLRDLSDTSHQMIAFRVGHSRRRLVQKYKTGVHRQGPRNANTTLVGMGKHTRRNMRLARDPEPLKDVHCASMGLAAAKTHAHRANFNVLAGWHFLEQTAGLKRPRDPATAYQMRRPSP